MRPLIGITTYRQEAHWGFWQRQAALLPVGYVDAVADAGGVPVLLPPVGFGAAEAVAALDGLILSGGADLDPAGSGAAPHPETGEPQTLRDAGDLAVLRTGLNWGLPVLAICRGMQVLKVAAGGTLHQRLPDTIGHDGHRHQLGPDRDFVVAVPWHPEEGGQKPVFGALVAAAAATAASAGGGAIR